ncbi:MAG: helix-turn-helix transcriptional regulator [Gemmatimonadota bacterium]|jgi:transcriptional regulator with XRE-family HTH domain|nr:hypothetical protein [Gemmatimonadota bacterium]MDP6528125.1 helix-turn-helix transcriptional regulator [Gemmatimonadota bacterium]MDP6802571.1 helix-turn-helix transcriptional regulator [Gemmatimonadota bacterium]MDP7032740.1 helix-turn-helix transcriptional regulator [Gemmatimonadota bacterium]
MSRIGENVRFYRNLRELTQTALARQVQVAPAYISQIEANQRVPSLKVTRRIADVLGIDMSILVREGSPGESGGTLTDSEKLDLLRALILSIENSPPQAGAEDVPVAEGRNCVARELFSEPAFCVVHREFQHTVTFGKESSESDAECHIVLEGEIRSSEDSSEVTGSGESRSLHAGDGDRLVARGGTRVVSLYAPRVELARLVDSVTVEEPTATPVP